MGMGALKGVIIETERGRSGIVRVEGREGGRKEHTVGEVVSLLSALKSITLSVGILASVDSSGTHILVCCEQSLVPLSGFAVLWYC